MLVKQVSARASGAVGFALLGMASVMTIFAAASVLMFTSMAVFGIGIWADYFGRRHMGSIRGAVTPVT